MQKHEGRFVAAEQETDVQKLNGAAGHDEYQL
jgi:hypothetical protein